MLFPQSLEVAISITFIFAILSLVVTATMEIIELQWKKRAQTLFDGIREMLGDASAPNSGGDGPAKPGTAEATVLYEHPLIQSLLRGSAEAAIGGKTIPSYLPPANFALALIDQVLRGRFAPDVTNSTLPASASAIDRFRLALERIDNNQLRRVLKQAVQVSGGDLEEVRRFLETWYEGATDRFAGWYKRHTQIVSMVVGFALAVALNVNAITVITAFYADKTHTAVTELVAAGNGGKIDAASINADAALQAIANSGAPIGWTEDSTKTLLRPVGYEPKAGGQGEWQWTEMPAPLRFFGYVEIFLGYLLTALATSLGAPFWFDFLNRLMVIRATVKPAEKSPEADAKPSAKAQTDSKTTIEVVSADTETKPALLTQIDTTIFGTKPSATDRLFEDDHGEPITATSADGDTP